MFLATTVMNLFQPFKKQTGLGVSVTFSFWQKRVKYSDREKEI